MKKLIYSFLVLSILLACQKENKNKDTRYTYELSRLKVEYVNQRSALIGELQSNFKGYNNLIQNLAITIQTSFLNLAKANWPSAYGTYIQIQPYTYANSAVQTDLNKQKVNFDISDINMSYIDYTAAEPNAGIINNATQYPNLYSLADFHQVGNEKNVTIGFHVLEFLLWGEDTNLPGDQERMIGEFANASTNGERRRNFIKISSSRLKESVEKITNYEQSNNEIKKLSNQDFIAVLFNPLIEQLDFLAKEAIKKPLDSQNKNDVLCPHSDKSKEVILEIIRSAENYINPYGENNQFNDYSLIQFMQEEKPEIADNILSNFTVAKESLSDIANTFEDAISNSANRVNILAAYNSIVEIKNLLIEFRDFISKNQ